MCFGDAEIYSPITREFLPVSGDFVINQLPNRLLIRDGVRGIRYRAVCYHTMGSVVFSRFLFVSFSCNCALELALGTWSFSPLFSHFVSFSGVSCSAEHCEKHNARHRRANFVDLYNAVRPVFAPIFLIRPCRWSCH